MLESLLANAGRDTLASTLSRSLLAEYAAC